MKLLKTQYEELKRLEKTIIQLKKMEADDFARDKCSRELDKVIRHTQERIDFLNSYEQ